MGHRFIHAGDEAADDDYREPLFDSNVYIGVRSNSLQILLHTATRCHNGGQEPDVEDDNNHSNNHARSSDTRFHRGDKAFFHVHHRFVR